MRSGILKGQVMVFPSERRNPPMSVRSKGLLARYKSEKPHPRSFVLLCWCLQRGEIS